MRDPDTDTWLLTLPLGEPVAIDGVEIWLKTFPAGAELGAWLLQDFTEPELQDSLRKGFHAAIEFDAGFGLSVDGRSLCLSQWLPGVHDWIGAAEALERLLNQVELLRGDMAPVRSPAQERIEQRMRKMLEGGIK